MPWHAFSISLAMESGSNLFTTSFRSLDVTSRVMISTIFLRIARTYTFICANNVQQFYRPLNQQNWAAIFGYSSSYLAVQVGLISNQGYVPERSCAYRTQNTHFKQCISWEVGEMTTFSFIVY